MATDAWSSIPWEIETEGEVFVWHKSRVPYTTDANALQNLDVWVPVAGEQANEIPDASTLPARKGLWVIFIHGGAWRDALVTSAAFAPTIKELAGKHSAIFSEVVGFASINYTLSARPKDPAALNQPDLSSDPSRNAKHPDHIVDVLTALSFLQDKTGFGNNYVLSGHSCGATLAFQVAMSHSKWGSSVAALSVAKPKAIIGLNGLYDMPSLIANPGEKHAYLKGPYEVFTRQAFGDDEKVWQEVMPISVSDWKTEWGEGNKAILVQSHEDTLVPYSQLAGFMEKLSKSKAEGLVVEEMAAPGDHNELWSKGDRLAEIVVEVVKGL